MQLDLKEIDERGADTYLNISHNTVILFQPVDKGASFFDNSALACGIVKSVGCLNYFHWLRKETQQLFLTEAV